MPGLGVGAGESEHADDLVVFQIYGDEGRLRGQAGHGAHRAEQGVEETGAGGGADLADRHYQPAPVPASNHLHRDLQEIRQHGGRVQSPHMLLVLDQSQLLPQLRSMMAAGGD